MQRDLRLLRGSWSILVKVYVAGHGALNAKERGEGRANNSSMSHVHCKSAPKTINEVNAITQTKP